MFHIFSNAVNNIIASTGSTKNARSHNVLLMSLVLFFRVFVLFRPIPQAPISCCFARFAAMENWPVVGTLRQQNEVGRNNMKGGPEGANKTKTRKKRTDGADWGFAFLVMTVRRVVKG
jgi:hypothetical protein